MTERGVQRGPFPHVLCQGVLWVQEKRPEGRWEGTAMGAFWRVLQPSGADPERPHIRHEDQRARGEWVAAAVRIVVLVWDRSEVGSDVCTWGLWASSCVRSALRGVLVGRVWGGVWGAGETLRIVANPFTPAWLQGDSAESSKRWQNRERDLALSSENEKIWQRAWRGAGS